MDLDLFTSEELAALHEHVYRWGIRLYDRTSHLFAKVMEFPIHLVPGYEPAKAAYMAALAAANEQHELLRDIGAEISRRRETVNA